MKPKSWSLYFSVWNFLIPVGVLRQTTIPSIPNVRSYKRALEFGEVYTVLMNDINKWFVVWTRGSDIFAIVLFFVPIEIDQGMTSKSQLSIRYWKWRDGTIIASLLRKKAKFRDLLRKDHRLRKSKMPPSLNLFKMAFLNRLQRFKSSKFGPTVWISYWYHWFQSDEPL